RLNVQREDLESPISAGLAGGVGPLADHFARLGDPDDVLRGSRRTRLRNSMADVAQHMSQLSEELYTLMGTLPAVHILGVTGEAAAGARTDNRIPRLSFAVKNVPAKTVHQRLFSNGLVTTLTPRSELLTEMGVDDIGGAVTVSLSPFNTHQDIEHLIRVVASLA
ncbi:MAG: aminotransferase class V-fold PLP-dependent enzyme, partial [Corynebacterium casei]